MTTVTAIPLILAISSQIPLKQKRALCGVFSMTLIVTLFAIVRFSLNNPFSPPAGPSWIQVWSTIEASVSIAIASAASFRTFVLQQKESSRKASGGALDDSNNSGRKYRSGEKSGFSQLPPFGSRSGRRDLSEDSIDLELLDTNKADQMIVHTTLPHARPNSAF